MAHALSFGGRYAGDVGDHRLGHIGADKLRCFFLGRATDLADHHDRLGAGVFLKQTQNIDKARPRNRVAADADAGRLAVTHVSGLLDRLVGQRTGARHDAHLTRQMNIRRHDADLALPRRDHAGAVGPDQPDTQLIAFDLRVEHVECRHTLGDTNDQLNARAGRLKNGVFARGRRDVDHRGLRLGLGNGLSHRIEHRQVEVCLPTLSGGHTADHHGAVSDRLLRMESTLRASESLADHAGVLIDQDTHDAPPAAATTFWAASVRLSAA